MTTNEVWFESSGTRLYALEVGKLDSDRPIVFMHGGLADHRAAMLYVGPLLAAHRVILPDLRGAGRSVYAEELTWHALAADVVALLDHLQIDRAAIGGSSMGSGVALRCALDYPERTLGLFLTAPVFRGAALGFTHAQAEAMRGMGEAGELALARGVEALIPLYDSLPIAVRARASEMLRSFDAASVATTTRLLASGAQPFDAAADLTMLNIPALIVPGTDQEHPQEVADLYAKNIAHAQQAAADAPNLPTLIQTFASSLPWL